jgi:hypothetical protein
VGNGLILLPIFSFFDAFLLCVLYSWTRIKQDRSHLRWSKFSQNKDTTHFEEKVHSSTIMACIVVAPDIMIYENLHVFFSCL